MYVFSVKSRLCAWYCMKQAYWISNLQSYCVVCLAICNILHMLDQWKCHIVLFFCLLFSFFFKTKEIFSVFRKILQNVFWEIVVENKNIYCFHILFIFSPKIFFENLMTYFKYCLRNAFFIEKFQIINFRKQSNKQFFWKLFCKTDYEK